MGYFVECFLLGEFRFVRVSLVFFRYGFDVFFVFTFRGCCLLVGLGVKVGILFF